MAEKRVGAWSEGGHGFHTPHYEVSNYTCISFCRSPEKHQAKFGVCEPVAFFIVFYPLVQCAGSVRAIVTAVCSQVLSPRMSQYVEFQFLGMSSGTWPQFSK